MSDDIPEREFLNLEESLTCLRVSLVCLTRALDRTASEFSRVADSLRPMMDDHMEDAP